MQNEALIFRKQEERFVHDPTKFFQLTPSLPEGYEEYAVVLQKGPYSGEWIRVIKNIETDQLHTLVEEKEALQKRAVYISIPQHIIATNGTLFATILQWGYSFYNFYPPTNEYILYKWVNPNLEDRVPSYSTSIEGGGALLLSPDETKVLLVYENGRWSRLGGSTNRGEATVTTAIRESVEESGVKIDQSFEVLHAVSYNQPKARDGIINDHFSIYVLRAESTEMKVDETEIENAQWWEIEWLVKAWKMYVEGLKKDELIDSFIHIEIPEVMQGKIKISSMVLLGLERYKEGKCTPLIKMRSQSPALRIII